MVVSFSSLTPKQWHPPTLKPRKKMGCPNEIPAPKEPQKVDCPSAPCSHSFSSKRPTKAGAYWIKCYETDNESDFVNVFWNHRELVAKIDCGTYTIADVCNGLTDVQWAPAIIISENVKGLPPATGGAPPPRV